jgi:AcrR family transcriptional regulator
MPVNREAVIGVAAHLLRDQGLDGVSFRKIAAELGVSAPTLYWHVASKRELLDLLAEHLVRARSELVDDEPAPDQSVWEWLAERSTAMFDALVETRDAPLVVAGNRPTVDSLPGLDKSLQALAEAGLSPGRSMQALLAIGSYIVGSATEWQAEADRGREGEKIDVELGTQIASGRYPHVAAAVAAAIQEPPRATFEFGLRLLIDGLRTQAAGGSDEPGDGSSPARVRPRVRPSGASGSRPR